jgi:H+/Cl- antiporter ClcA
VLFFGYSTLDAILAGPSTLPQGGGDLIVTAEALTLLIAKLAATVICLGSGLVGGSFAPSLFLGAVLGVAFHGAAAAGLDAAIGVLPQVAPDTAVCPHTFLTQDFSRLEAGKAFDLNLWGRCAVLGMLVRAYFACL